jgi:4-hydroxy-tetrahydrodipicolinate synthase
VALLFAEPNPAPLKYLLHAQGVIASDELRLPLVPVSEGLQRQLDALAR